MKSTIIRALAGLGAGALLVAAAPAAGVAANDGEHGPSHHRERFTGGYADAWWTVVDEESGPNGNYHEGGAWIYTTGDGTGDAYLYIVDWDCPEGRTPYDDWYEGEEGGEEPTGPGCTFVDERYGEGWGLPFTMDNRLEQAHVAGEVAMYSYDWETGEETVGDGFAIDLTFTGEGRLSRGIQTYQFHENGYHEMFRSRSTSREASVTGTVDDLDLATADQMGGWMSFFQDSYQGHYRGR